MTFWPTANNDDELMSNTTELKSVDDVLSDSAILALNIVTYMNLIHVPLVVVTNGAVMVIIYQIKRLHTPYNYTVFALAMTDFMFALVVICNAVNDIGGHSTLEKSLFGCVLFNSVQGFVYQSSLNMLLLLCVDRLLQTKRSIDLFPKVNKNTLKD